MQGDLSALLGTGTGVRKDTLITNADVPPSDVGDPRTHSWDADRLRDKLFGSRHDLMFLAGHFSANDALAADYRTSVSTQELADPTPYTTATSGAVSVKVNAFSGFSAPVDAIETTVAADQNSFSYDATTNSYTYTWKTQKDWSGTCKRLVLRFTNGTDHTADFKFTE